MIVAIHQPQYLPWIPYCEKADAADVFVYLDHVQFQKNGVQNRNQIKGPHGPMWLTVPVRASLERSICDTPLADQRWQKKHLRSIEQAYARAESLALVSGLRSLLDREWEFLGDLNVAVTEWLFERLAVKSRRVRASDLAVSGTKESLVIEICRALGASIYLSGPGARAYQDPERFQRYGIELRYESYRNQPYPQCFPGAGFTPDLSALDLVLNAGQRAGDVMRAGRSETSASARPSLGDAEERASTGHGTAAS